MSTFVSNGISEADWAAVYEAEEEMRKRGEIWVRVVNNGFLQDTIEHEQAFDALEGCARMRGGNSNLFQREFWSCSCIINLIDIIYWPCSSEAMSRCAQPQEMTPLICLCYILLALESSGVWCNHSASGR